MTTDAPPTPDTVTWRHSERPFPRLVLRPFLRFMVSQPAPAAAMTVAALVALVWANSPWSASYETLWNTQVDLHVGHLVSFPLTMRSLVNDGGMALFFLLVGVELKYEALRGHLRKPGAALLPALGALGGILVPAAVYLALNAGHPGERGWGIPIATDVAFAVGVVALVGSRIDSGARVFLLTLAIVDDVGGIIVISIFYSNDLNLAWLAVVAACVAAVGLLRFLDVRSLVPYTALGLISWFALHEAGIEPAIVGVVFGLLAPLDPFHPAAQFGPEARRRTEQADHLLAAGSEHTDDATRALLGLADWASLTAPPGPRLEQRLRIWVNLAVLPLFALANAGVHIGGTRLDGRVFFGVLVGLVLGKLFGIFAITWGTGRLRPNGLPAGLTARSLLAVSSSAGMGFSVSLFIAALAFSNADLTATASLAVLAATAVAGMVSLTLARLFVPKSETGAVVAPAPASVPS